MRVLKSIVCGSAILLGFAALSIPGATIAQASTITATGSSTLTQGSTLGPGTYGTVSYTFSGDTVAFTVQLASGYEFISTGFGAVFAFTTSIPITYNTPTFGSGLLDGTTTGTSYPVKMDGAGWFGGGINAAQTGGSSNYGSLLEFTITGASAIALINGLSPNGIPLTDFFAADICVATNGACTGATGIVYDGLSINPQSLPLPSAALLFGTALVGMGILGRRRRKGQLTQA